MSDLPKPSFILASVSERRKQLLAEAGYNFEPIGSDIDESAYSTTNISPLEYAKKLALAKAGDVAKKYPSRLVIGADTVVDFDGEIIGKAGTETHAEEITRKLFSKPHKVITAIAMVRIADNTEIVDAEVTVVFPKKLSNEQIRAHIKSRTWQNKAGAYAIQLNGDEFIEQIHGSFTNVVGLGMELFSTMFQQLNKPKIPLQPK